MSHPRLAVPAVVATAFAFLFFGLGSFLAARPGAESEEIAALRAEIERLKTQPPTPTGTSGVDPLTISHATETNRAAIVEDVKRQLRSEMGLLPINLIRDRRQSFVELYSYDDKGSSSYGTAGYLGNGYFITVKHGVVALNQDAQTDPRKITSVKLMYKGQLLSAKVVDAGDANVEVDPGDWAIVKVKEKVELTPLNVNMAYGFDFADPIFRLGNDYSKG